MIEPTETESKQKVDRVCEAFIAIAKEAKENPDLVKTAPHNTYNKRFDEAFAARNPVLKWTKEMPTEPDAFVTYAKNLKSK